MELKKECPCGRSMDCNHCHGAGFEFDIYAIKGRLDASESAVDDLSDRHYSEILLERITLNGNSPAYVEGLTQQLKAINSILFTYADDKDEEIDLFVRRYEGFYGST